MDRTRKRRELATGSFRLVAEATVPELIGLKLNACLRTGVIYSDAVTGRTFVFKDMGCRFLGV